MSKIRKKLKIFLLKTRLSMSVLREALSVIKRTFSTKVLIVDSIDEVPEEYREEYKQQQEEEIPHSNTPHEPKVYNVINFKGLQEIPEENIIQAARAFGNVPNSFAYLLFQAQAYKSMDIEPVYLTNKSQDEIRVAAREVWENPRILN